MFANLYVYILTVNLYYYISIFRSDHLQRRVKKKIQYPGMGPWTPRELVHWDKGNIKGKLLFIYRAIKLIYSIHLTNINTDQRFILIKGSNFFLLV